jgi:hypothetical protein
VKHDGSVIVYVVIRAAGVNAFAGDENILL